MKSILVILTLIALSISQNGFFEKVVVNDKDALCLDGTPGVYYLYKGKDPKKFIIYFQGGAWCGDKDLAATTQNCYQRSKGDLGSSKAYPASYTINDGIMSDNPKNSFANYTKAHFKYCDGSGHQGTRSSPISYKDTKLYFRGSNLTISKLDDLQKKLGLFSNSTEIIVTGGSAGGLAAFTWADYIRERSHHKNVYSVPDSGIFLDSTNYNSKINEYSTAFMNLFKLSNTQSNPPVSGCVRAFPTQTYKCMLAQHMHSHIITPLFPVQSLYDSWSLPNIIGMHCAKGRSLAACNETQRKYIEEYHQNTTKVIEEIGRKAQNGYWAPVCVDHVYMWGALYSPDYEIPMHSNNTIDKALLAWIEKKPIGHKYIDKGAWPENKPCSGVAQLRFD